MCAPEHGGDGSNARHNIHDGQNKGGRVATHATKDESTDVCSVVAHREGPLGLAVMAATSLSREMPDRARW